MITSTEQLQDYCSFEDPAPGKVAGFMGDAVLLWMSCQGRPDVTVAEAMMVWNCSRELLVEAAEHNHYLFINGDKLEMDGDA